MKNKGIFFLFLLTCFSLYGAEPPKIPDDPSGVIWCPLAGSFWDDADLITYIVTGVQGYKAPLEDHEYKTDRNLNNNSLLNFMEMFRDEDWNPRDYIELHTHGGDNVKPEWLAAEFYSSKDTAIERVRIFKLWYPEHENNIEWRIVINATQSETLYTVSVNAIFLTDRLPTLNNSIAYVGACYSSKVGPTGSSLVQSFLNKGAMTSFGWDYLTTTTENTIGGFCIFKHMCGWIVGGDYEKRNKTALEAMNDYKSYYNHPNKDHIGVFGNFSTKFYNSPRIVGMEVYQGFWLIYRYGFYDGGVFPEYPYQWDYPGDLSGCPRNSASIGNQPIHIKILFSSLMDQGNIQVEIVEESGNFTIPVNGWYFSGHIFDYDVWEGACDFSEWSGGANAVVRVDAEDAFEGDINARLDTDGDGNSDEKDTNHKFWVGLPPQVTETDPADGTSNVDVYTPNTISFNKEMDQTTVNSGTVFFSPPLHGGFSTQWSGDGKTVTLTFTNPQEDLELYEDYNIIVTDSVTDIDGTQLDGDRDGEPGGNYEFWFKTRLPKVILDPKVFARSIKEGGGGAFSIRITNLEERGVNVSLIDDIFNPGGWITSSASGSYTLNANQVKPLSYSVYNGGAEDILYHHFSLTYSEQNLDNAEHAYFPLEEKPPDHPDEGPVVNPQYPTPWYLDTESQVGILLNGYFAGVGHLLGRYKINTCAVKKENLKVLGEPNRSLYNLSVLIIPTGGLMGMEYVTNFIQGLEDFINQGGTVVCLTQQYGYDWSILSDAPSGYGWREDQSCWKGAGYFSDWDVILSGQNSAIINTHIDGFFIDLPQNSKVIMKRRVSGMPELFYYDFGLGKVLVCGLYTDWGYGQAQWSQEEANLIRDIVTWSIDTERPIQEYYGGDALSLDIPVYYYPGEDTMPANKVRIKIQNPNRDSIYSTEFSLSPVLYPGNSTIVNLTDYNTPFILGIYPVNYSLYNDTQLLQEEIIGERFAVKIDIPVGEYMLGDLAIWATAESEGIPYGSNAIFTVFLRNSTSTPFAGKIMIGVHEQGGVWWQIVDSLINTEISPDTFITVSYTRPLYKSTSTYFGLYDLNTNYYSKGLTNAIVRCQKGIWIVPSDCNVTVTTDKDKYFKSENVIYNIEATSNVTDTCAIIMQIVDINNNSMDSISLGCYLDSTHAFTYTDSIRTDTSWNDGRYTLKATAYHKEHPIGFNRSYFYIKSGLINLSFIPDTAISGQDTMRYVVTIEPETLTIYNSKFNYTLKSPKATYTELFTLDSLRNDDTITIPVTLPEDSLRFGRYTYKYTLYSIDTIVGSYRFNHNVYLDIQNDQYCHYWGDTLKFSIALKNTGQCSLSVLMEVEVEKPQGNYCDSVEINLVLNTDTTFHFKTLVDPGTPAGNYKLSSRIHSGNSMKKVDTYYKVLVRPPDIMIATDTTNYSIGDTVTVILYNAGHLEGDVRLTEVSLQDIHYNSFPFDTARYLIPGGDFAFYMFTVPEVMSGPYYLNITGNVENYNIPINEREYLWFNGIEADISLRTSKDIYRPADEVKPQANCVNGNYQFNGDMNLSITPAGLYPGDTTFIPGDEDMWQINNWTSPGCTLSNNKLTL
ncbi:Ig-like domain-containing protein, partial [candidate division WOR-3 bacterium]|nr:Ig-like domain-containing protein [candidate division WOR-3 bacterium]